MTPSFHSPRWARALLRFVAPRHREDDVLGDLEESDRIRTRRRSGIRRTPGASLADVRTEITTVGARLAAWVMQMAFNAWALGAACVRIVLGYLALVSTVCPLACIIPTARGLAIEPTQAL